MNVNKAYNLTMQKVTNLRQSIDTTIKLSKGRNNKDTVEKYNLPDRLDPKRWYHITFLPMTSQEANQIAQARKELGWQGICFDTGGSFGYRDWEINWSFRVEDVPDGEWEKRSDEIEEFIQSEIEKSS